MRVLYDLSEAHVRELHDLSEKCVYVHYMFCVRSALDMFVLHDARLSVVAPTVAAQTD